MYSIYTRKKSRPMVILLTLLILWAQMGVMAAPAHAETPGPTTVSQEVYAYKDITPAQPDYIFVNYLKKAGLISGFPDGTFRPQAGLTRAEAATLLVKAAALKTGTAKPGFRDVTAKHWAARYIAAAKSAGIINGYKDGTFHPDARLTRAEGITLVLKLSKQSDSGVDLPILADVKPQHWAARPIATGIASEMVSLTSDKKHFLPDANFNRSALARALAILLTKDSTLYQTALPNTLTVTTGTVHVTRAKSTTSESINSTTVLKIGDSVTVDQASSADLAFPDGTGLRLEQNIEFTLKESKGRSYIRPDGTPGTAVESLNIDLKRGKMFGALATSAYINGNNGNTDASGKSAASQARAMGLGNLSEGRVRTAAAATKPLPWWQQSGTKRTKVKVDMPTGVAAIRGTFWENQVAPDGSFKTSLLTGDAVVTSNSGQNVNLAAGQRTEVQSAGAPPAPPTPLTASDRQEWLQVAAWAQQQATIIAQNQERALPPPPPADLPNQTPPPLPEQGAGVLTPPDITQTISNAIEGVRSTPSQTNNNTGGSNAIPVFSLSLNASQIHLYRGDNPYVLTPLVAPSDATNKAVKWSITNLDIANVDPIATVVNGIVVPLAAGEALVTATTTDGSNQQASCLVIVE